MENKRFLSCLVAGILLSVACAFGQTTTQYFKVDKTATVTYKGDSIIITNTVFKRDTLFPDTAAILALKCSTVVQPQGKALLRVLYIGSEFATIFKTPAQAAALKKYLKDYKYNGVSYYGLSNISSSDWGTLRAFNEDLVTNYGIILIEATASSLNGFKERARFNSLCTNPKQKFTRFNKESEYWNADTNGDKIHSDPEVLAAWKLDSVDAAACKALALSIGVEFVWYHGWPLKSQIPIHLNKVQDLLMYHDYTLVPSTSYINTRLTMSNNAQKAIDITIKKETIILVSAETAFMREWLKTHSIDELIAIFEPFVNSFSNLKFAGIQMFMYSEVIKSQPAKTNSAFRMLGVPADTIDTTAPSHIETSIPRY